MSNKITSAAVATFTITQCENMRTAGLNGTAAFVVWGFQNPGLWASVCAGKTPKAFKQFKAGIESKADANKVRRMVTASKQASLVLFDMALDEKALAEDTATRKDFADHCARMAARLDGLTITQAVKGHEEESGIAALIADKVADSIKGITDKFAAVKEGDLAPTPEADAAPEAEADAAPEAEAEADAMDVNTDTKTATAKGVLIVQAFLNDVRSKGHDLPQGFIAFLGGMIRDMASKSTMGAHVTAIVDSGDEDAIATMRAALAKYDSDAIDAQDKASAAERAAATPRKRVKKAA